METVELDLMTLKALSDSVNFLHRRGYAHKVPVNVMASIKSRAVKQGEEKAFRKFAVRRLKENDQFDITTFEFKYVDEQRQRQLFNEFGVPDPDAEMVLKAILKAVEHENTK